MVFLSNGRLLLEDETRPFFQQLDLLFEKGVYPPGAMRFFHELARAGYSSGYLPLTVEEAAEKLAGILARSRSSTQQANERIQP
jgi:hypothetical protein